MLTTVDEKIDTRKGVGGKLPFSGWKQFLGWMIYVAGPTIPEVHTQIVVQSVGALLAAIGILDNRNREKIIVTELARVQQKTAPLP